MTRRLWILIAGVLLLADSPAAGPSAPPFSASQYEHFAKDGKARIDGVFVLRVGSGDPKPQSGASVMCIPDLPYTEWALAATANAINRSSDSTASGTPSAEDPKLGPYTRTTKTDSNGNFHFYRLPYGRYVLRVSIITPFPRIVHDQLPVEAGAVYNPSQPAGPGLTVYDYSHAYFDSQPVYAGPRPPFAPDFHFVARHNTFDPRR